MINDMQDILTAAFQSQMNNVYTSIPCVVVSFSGSSRVNIQPALNQKMKDGGVKERPVIQSVPVSFPVSKTAGFTFPIKPGDTGIAVFSMRSLEAWKSSDGYPSTPPNYAKMDKNDAMFIPGIQPEGISVNNPSRHVWDHSIEDTVMFNGLGANEAEVRIRPSGNILFRTHQNISVECDNAEVIANSSASINTPELSINATNTLWTGNVTHNGVFSFNGVIFSTHRHPPSTSPPSN